jgi:hypothetical protein
MYNPIERATVVAQHFDNLDHRDRAPVSPINHPGFDDDARNRSCDVFDAQGRDDHSQPHASCGHGANASCDDRGAGTAPVGDHQMAVLVGGEAGAAGYNTATTGFIDNTVQKSAGVTVAIGEADFTAVGQSAGHGNAAAQASTFVNVTGADFLFEIKINESGHLHGMAWAESEVEYVAVDIPNWQPPGGHTITEMLTLNVHDVASPQDHSALSGNTAQVLAMAQAYGLNTDTWTLTQAQTVEHHSSFVSASALTVA